MNIVADDCHLVGRYFFWVGGGGGWGVGRVNLAEPDQQAYFDHFPPISTHIFQGIII